MSLFLVTLGDPFPTFCIIAFHILVVADYREFEFGMQIDVSLLNIPAIRMTLSNFQGHSPAPSLFKCGLFSYSCAAVDKILTDIVRRAVPLR